MKILVVEDEPHMQLGLRKNLEFEGYEVDIVDDGAQAVDAILENDYRIVILDVMLPGLNGFEVCKKVRAAGNKTPIIMLTAKGEEIDRVLGLELGADDYITKPFSLRELLARIKAILRRMEDSGQQEKDVICIGKLTANLSTYTADCAGAPVTMTHREFEILKYLWKHKNQIVSRDQILDEIWGTDEMITSRTIDNFILKLRQKIEEKSDFPRHILTVHKVGYKLIP
ncbi:response regulator [candidate division KSB1 bacterium]|nr:response regulator [candidate division KSB1 bacterium]